MAKSKIEVLETKREQLKAQIARIRARDKKVLRARDTRRKVIIGGIVLKWAKDGKLEQSLLKKILAAIPEKEMKLFSDIQKA